MKKKYTKKEASALVRILIASAGMEVIHVEAPGWPLHPDEGWVAMDRLAESFFAWWEDGRLCQWSSAARKWIAVSETGIEA